MVLFTFCVQEYGTVENTLIQYKQEKLLQAMKGNTVFTDIHRKAMLRILLKELTKVQGYYPPDEAKEELAKSIVREFPKLKNDQTEEGYVSTL